jgi:serralysin
VQDAAGNDLATLTAQAVTNNTAGAPAPSPGPSPAPAPAPGVTTTAPAAGGTVQGSAGNDTLSGQAGNDRFVLGGGTDTVNGGAGLNTVVEAGTRAQYTLSHTADGTFTVKGADGSVAALQNVQRITFGDVTIALDITPATGRVGVLYQMALGRNPEGNGLDYYLAQPGTASTLQKAQGFVASAEFAGRYGSLTDSAFITQMYANAFGRAPDAGGMAFYLDALSHTTPLEGRAGLLAGFLDSAEMGVKLVGLVDQGVPLLAG